MYKLYLNNQPVVFNSKFGITFQNVDIDNPTERKVSYTSSIKVLYKGNENYFKNLNDIRADISLDVSEALLTHNQVLIFKGYGIIQKITKEYFTIVLYKKEKSFFKNLTGNINQLNFDSMDSIKINKDTITQFYNNKNNNDDYQILRTNRGFLPAVSEDEVVKKIIEKQGYNLVFNKKATHKKYFIPFTSFTQTDPRDDAPDTEKEITTDEFNYVWTNDGEVEKVSYSNKRSVELNVYKNTNQAFHALFIPISQYNGFYDIKVTTKIWASWDLNYTPPTTIEEDRQGITHPTSPTSTKRKIAYHTYLQEFINGQVSSEKINMYNVATNLTNIKKQEEDIDTSEPEGIERTIDKASTEPKEIGGAIRTYVDNDQFFFIATSTHYNDVEMISHIEAETETTRIDQNFIENSITYTENFSSLSNQQVLKEYIKRNFLGIEENGNNITLYYLEDVLNGNYGFEDWSDYFLEVKATDIITKNYAKNMIVKSANNDTQNFSLNTNTKNENKVFATSVYSGNDDDYFDLNNEAVNDGHNLMQISLTTNQKAYLFNISNEPEIPLTRNDIAKGFDLDDFINNHQKLFQIVEKYKKVTIVVELPYHIINNLDLKKLIYIKQLHSFFYLNKIPNCQPGAKSKIELIKL